MKGGEGENCEANLGEECFRQWKQCKGPEAGGCLVGGSQCGWSRAREQGTQAKKDGRCACVGLREVTSVRSASSCHGLVANESD